MESLIIRCPKEELEISKKTADSLGAVYTEPVSGGFTNVSQPTGTELKGITFCSIVPTFTILSEETLKMTKTKKEEGCLYYGFTKYDDKLVCREAYKDGEAINKNVKNVGDMHTAALEGGIIKLESINVQGPTGEIEVSRKLTEALGTEYIETVVGLARFNA